MVQLLRKTVWWFPEHLNIELPYDAAIPLLGMYLKELKTDSNRYLNMGVPSSIIHNHQYMEISQPFVSR